MTVTGSCAGADSPPESGAAAGSRAGSKRRTSHAYASKPHHFTTAQTLVGNLLKFGHIVSPLKKLVVGTGQQCLLPGQETCVAFYDIIARRRAACSLSFRLICQDVKCCWPIAATTHVQAII